MEMQQEQSPLPPQHRENEPQQSKEDALAAQQRGNKILMRQHQQVQLQEQQQQQQGQEQQEQHLQEDASVEALLASRLAAQQLRFKKVMRKIYIIQSKLHPGCSVLEAVAGMGEHQLLGELLQPYQENGMSQPDLRKDVHAAALRAATQGHAQCLRRLLDWDPSSTPELLEARDPEGCTLLIICAAEGDVDCMRLLLAHSPDTQVAAVTPMGRSALITACKNQHPAAVELLLQYSPLTQVAALNSAGWNALMLAVKNGKGSSTSGGDGAADAIVQLLLRHSPAAQVAAANERRSTALGIAACNGLASCLPLLLAHSPQAQVAAADRKGWTPLMFAATRGNEACVGHLLAHSPDTQVAAANAQGHTALMRAAIRGRKPCLQLLLEHSPEVQLAAVTGARQSAVSLAAREGHVDCLQLLLDHSPPQQQLDQALLEAGQKLSQQQQAAPADEQLRRGWTTCIERLLAAGAWTPANVPEGVVDIVRSISKRLTGQALVPCMANEAVVGLAGAVRHLKRRAGEDAAGPSKHARPSP